MCLHVALEAARSQGKPGLVWCLEMPVSRLLEKIVASHRKVPHDELTPLDYKLTWVDMKDVPLYFCRATTGLDHQRVFDTVRYAARRFGIRVFVLDHLHFLCRDIRHVTQEIATFTRELKLLSQELSLVSIVIAHPRKVQPGHIPTGADTRDSGEIEGDSDWLLTLYRKPIQGSKVTEQDYVESQHTLEPRTLIRVWKGRYSGGGSTVLRFNGPLWRFEEYEDE